MRGLLPTIGFVVSSMGAEARDLATDRPDTTESPITVPAGRFQIEAEALAHSWKGGHSTSWTLAESLLKFGVTEQMDLQLNVPVYVRLRAANDEWAEGFGNLALRMKFNLWGNDEGRSALAVLPYLSAPTAAKGLGSAKWEPGLALPFSFELTDRFNLGLQQQFDWIDGGSGGRDLEWLHSIVLGVAVTERFGLFAEGVAILRLESGGGTDAALNLGWTYLLTPEFQLDGGVRLGLAGEADDCQVFVGWSLRI